MSWGKGKKSKSPLIGGSGVSRAISKAIGIPSISEGLYAMANPLDEPEPEIPKQVTLPDLTDASVRRRQADALKEALSRRGRSRTLLSGRAGDTSTTARRSATVGRA